MYPACPHPRTVAYSRVQSRTVAYSFTQSCTVAHTRVQSCTANKQKTFNKFCLCDIHDVKKLVSLDSQKSLPCHCHFFLCFSPPFFFDDDHLHFFCLFYCSGSTYVSFWILFSYFVCKIFQIHTISTTSFSSVLKNVNRLCFAKKSIIGVFDSIYKKVVIKQSASERNDNLIQFTS